MTLIKIPHSFHIISKTDNDLHSFGYDEFGNHQEEKIADIHKDLKELSE